MLSVVKALGFLGKIDETLVLPVVNLALARYVYSNQNNNTMLRYIVQTQQHHSWCCYKLSLHNLF